MKKPIFACTLIGVFFFHSSLFAYNTPKPPEAEIEFLLAKVEDIQSFAANEGKHVLLHFTASWCMPCQWMETTTYKNSNLASYVNENFLAKKVDIDDFEGRRLKEHYKVRLLPSVLVFNAEGKLIERINEAVEAKSLLQILKKHRIEVKEETPPIPEQLTLLATPKVNLQPLSKPKLQPNLTSGSISSPKINIQQPSSLQSQEDNAIQVEENRPMISSPYVQLTTFENKAKEHFSLQIGAFSMHTNADRLRKQHEDRLREPIEVKSEKRGNKVVYKVFVGDFQRKELAKKYQNHLETLGIKSIVKKIDISH